MRPLATIFGLLAASCATNGQGNAVGASGSAPAAIDVFCGRLVQAKHPTALSLFGFVQPDPRRDGTWKAFPTEAQLKSAVGSGEVFDQAYVWQLHDGVLVLLALSSASGDWIHYLDYCFRADGTLAKSTSTLNTFNVSHPERDVGPVSKEKTRYFNPSGREVGFSSRLLDLKTGRPAPELEKNFMDHDEPRIRRLDTLPFSSLLRDAAHGGVAPRGRSPAAPGRRSRP